MSVNCEVAFGFEVVFSIDEDCYELTYTGDDIGYALRWGEETQEAISGAIRRSLTHPRAVEQLDIQPGYIRARIDADSYEPDVAPKEIAQEFRQSRQLYNRHEATDPEYDGLSLKDRYVGVCRPESARSREAFLTQHAAGEDRVPNAGESVFHWEGSLPRPELAGGDRNIAYEYIIPIDPETYTEGRNSASFEWDDWACNRFEQMLSSRQRWPSKAILEFEIFPRYIRAVHHSGNLGTSPPRIANQFHQQVANFNTTRPVREGVGSGDSKRRQPKLHLKDRIYIGPVSPECGMGISGSGFIEDRGLDDVDGEVTEPVSELTDEDADTGEESSGWERINPF